MFDKCVSHFIISNVRSAFQPFALTLGFPDNTRVSIEREFTHNMRFVVQILEYKVENFSVVEKQR